MRIDPYNHKERYLAWKEKVKDGIPDISKANSDLILAYLRDMETGMNTALGNVRGPRSFIRLNTLREKLIFFSKKLKERYSLDKMTDITEEQICEFFSLMSNGEITRKDGKNYRSGAYFVSVFKAFWHWHQKINKKQGKELSDITQYLDARQEKPEWVYLTEDQVRKLCDNVRYEYRVLIMFLFDTGIRSPTELVNIKVSDLHDNCKEMTIRDEVSKTFGRRIKLLLCHDLIREYVKRRCLKDTDYLFPIKPTVVNRYLQRMAKRIFGDGKSLAGEKFTQLTMYDFRHIACCYWLPRYKSESALKYRFGWKKSDKIHYYSELLGMKDTISEEDLLVDVTKTEIERRLLKAEQDREIMLAQITALGDKLNKYDKFFEDKGNSIANKTKTS